MLLTLATVLLTALPTARTDTTISVRQGDRLNVSNFGGEIVVSSWGRNAVKVAAEHSSRARVDVRSDGPNIEVRASARRGIPVRVDYNIVVPAWMPLFLKGIYTDISVKGMKSEVSAETVKGEIRVEGGEGLVRASSVEGPVFINGARGRVELSTVNDNVHVTGSKGEIIVNAINGDIDLEGVESSLVEASTVSGDVMFLGNLHREGRYNLSTHNGNLTLGMAEGANATVSVSTFNGDFDSAFPVRLERTRHGKRFNFTMGSGSALVNLESFDGTIRLERPVDLKELVRIKGVRLLEAEKLREMRQVKRELRQRTREISDEDKARAEK